MPTTIHNVSVSGQRTEVDTVGYRMMQLVHAAMQVRGDRYPHSLLLQN